ncbi:MAG: transcriptional regulator, AraC family [Eubacterium sp.]|jgi:AraC family transcriptional regulator|nr:transcriptional regulator, AraC family [Eubacterium sp.]
MNENSKQGNNATLKEYHIRINKVLDYIENNLGSELSLDTLSKIACFSSYHFHRLFHSLSGETLAGYIKKRRLLAAANRLYYSQNPSLSDIAYEFGFSSQSDFSRSFKAFFNLSPSGFYKEKIIKKLQVSNREENIEHSVLSEAKKQQYEIGISIKRLADYRVAYIRNKGLSKMHKSPEIEASFIKLYTWAMARDLISRETIVMGITLDNPEILPLQECRHDTCITVDQAVEPDGVIGVRDIHTKAKYVSFKFDTGIPEFHKTFFEVIDYLYGNWIPLNGYIPEDKPCIELYKQNTENKHIYIELLIPVRPF